ncbi:MAG: efflux RND transporter permease subunit [Myxococcota bacterium]
MTDASQRDSGGPAGPPERQKPTGPLGTPAWERFIGFFVDNKLIVFVLAGLLIAAGIYVLPFDAGLDEDVPRDRVPVDAIPDIGENQQIVFTEWAGRSPRDVEDQVSYPLTTALLGIPGVETVRSSSMFGFSSIYVIFEDDVDFYWSRSRVLEKLASLPEDTLPDDVSPTLGPDATALGQVFWYTLQGRDSDDELTGGWDMHELRSIQDWQVRYALMSVPGVSEVASVGGYVQEYQIDVDPDAMRAHDVTLDQVASAVRRSNLDVGARTLEISRTEYLVRGLGFVEEAQDLEEAVVAARSHTPIRIGDLAKVGLGPAQRRGALDDAGAEAVGGVVVVRYGANPMEVIQRVKEKIAEIAPGLPKKTLDDGTTSQVNIAPFYDRTDLIDETLGTLSTALLQQILVTVIIVLLILRNLRSSVLISGLLPLTVLGSFVAMKYLSVDANIMALAGIAIAIGTMVDMGIVFVENIVEHLKRASPDADRGGVVKKAAAEVAPAVLTSVATTVVSFVPVFALTASEGKLFRPVAYTKTFAMIFALLLSMVVLPPLAHLIIRPRPGAPGTEQGGWRRVAASITRPAHLRDWVILAAGLLLAAWVPWLGAFVALLGVFRLAEPVLPGRWSKVPTIAEIAIAVLGVTWVLTMDWMPLGLGLSAGVNLLFVVLLLVLVLGSFALFQWFYPAVLSWSLRHKTLSMALPALLILFGATAWLGFDRIFGWLPAWARGNPPASTMADAFPGFGREFMPPFDEGSFLYMPTTMAHASLGQSLDTMKRMDAAIAQIPEVDRAVGKLGRADSPLDPAPVSMYETIVTYVPEYGTGPDGEPVRNWRDHIQSPDDIWNEIVKVAEAPGLTSAPVLMPIQTRIVMLQSGMRAPMGIKVRGPDLETIEAFGLRLEEILKESPALRRDTVNADRVVGKPYLEIDLDRQALGRYGLTVEQVQNNIQVALGGMPLTRTVEGRERYPVRVRYMREERDSVEALERMMVATPTGEQIPLGQISSLRYVKGPQVIKSEDTFLTSYVLFDKRRDISEVGAVEQAQALIEGKIAEGDLDVPDGVSYAFAGSYENQVRSEQRLMILIPIALSIIFLLLYLQFRRAITTLIIYSGVVLCVSTGFLLVWAYGQGWFLDFDLLGRSMRDLFQVGTVNLSVAVWVGVIALVGIATDNGVVLATYLKQRFEASPPETPEEVRQDAYEAGLRRLRPCLMTTATTLIALLPVITSQGRGADVMMPMALPSVGGMLGALLTLFVVPVLYAAVEERKLEKQRKQGATT